MFVHLWIHFFIPLALKFNKFLLPFLLSFGWRLDEWTWFIFDTKLFITTYRRIQFGSEAPSHFKPLTSLSPSNEVKFLDLKICPLFSCNAVYMKVL